MAIHRVALCFYKRHGLLITVWADQHITSQINVDVSVFSLHGVCERASGAVVLITDCYLSGKKTNHFTNIMKHTNSSLCLRKLSAIFR